MKYKLLRLSFLSMLVMLFGGLAHAADPDVTLDFTKQTNWNIPTSGSSNKDRASFTDGTNTIYLYATTNYKLNSGYLILGKKDSYLELPAFTFDVEKIEVVGTSGASQDVMQNIFVGDNAVSTATKGAKDVTNTYEIASGSQAAGTIYTLKVTSAHNTQISKIHIYKKADTSDTRAATTLKLTEGYATTGEVGGTIELPRYTVSTAIGSILESATVTWESSNTEVATINAVENIISLKAAGTTTIKATYAGDETNYKPSTASFTLTVKEYVAYTTIAAMLENITATKTDISYTFENLLVRYVNGKYTYVTDGKNNMLFFGSDLGLVAGDIIKGNVKGQLFTYNALPELSLTASDIKVEVASSKNDVIPSVIELDALANNINNYITIKSATYVSASNKNLTFKIDDSEFIAYNQFGLDVAGLVADKTYDITGFGSIYNSTIQIYPVSISEAVVENTWKGIKADFTNQSFFTEADANDTRAGLKMNEDGTFTRVSVEDETANAIIMGKWHSNDHGISNFMAMVDVEGPVKITMGTCAWGGEVTVQTQNGANLTTIGTFNTNTGACYHQDKEKNVVSFYYKEATATKLRISGGNYVPYFAVEAVDPAEIPNEATVSFDIAGVECEGVAPAELVDKIGSKVKIPANTTLYAEGKTLTTWTDGTNQYKAGDEITLAEDVTLTPVFTANEVSLADRTSAVHLEWPLGVSSGAGKINFQGNKGFIVCQTDVNGKKIDVKMDIDATSGKINNVGRTDQWAQVNAGTKFTIPSCKGAYFTTEAYSDITTTTINGETNYTPGKNIEYTVTSNAETLDIVIGDGSYYSIVKIDLPVVEQEESKFVDIKADFTNQSFFTEADANGATAGLKMNEDGTFTRVAADDATANAVISGKWHSKEHGISNFSATVKVEGPVKIILGTCAWGGNVTVKNAEGTEVVPSFTTNTGACYHQDMAKNVVAAYYTGEATTLTIAGGSYVPFFAVLKVNPEDIPHTAKVTFALGESGAEGVLPDAIEKNIGEKVKIPANTTLYAEGKTLTTWTDGTNQYKAGDEITLAEDVTLTPVFTANEVSLADRTSAVHLEWPLGVSSGAGKINFQGNKGFIVCQTDVNGKKIDVKMDIDATSGKINNVGRTDQWAQVNAGTKFTIPSCKGAYFTTEAYSDITTTTINGETNYTPGKNIEYTVTSNAETLDIVIGDGSYYSIVKIDLPVVEQEESKFVDIKADFTNQSFFTTADAEMTRAGLKMNQDGTFTRVSVEDETANAIITGKYHSDDHGISNFMAMVDVEGPVKITLGTCAWGGDVTVQTQNGANLTTIGTFNTNTGACYHQDKENNVVSFYYKEEVATKLRISGGSYVPYFAVEKVDPKDIPSDVKFIFDITESGAEGVAPAEEIAGIGKKYTLPKNFTLYKEGATLTGWTDGTNTYAPGEEITAPDAESVTLTPVFTANTVSLADRTEPVTLKYNFRRDAGAPTVAYQNATGIWVAQATIGDKVIDVKADFDTNNGGKFANGNWTDWAQLNNGTKWTIPSCKGATVSIEAYNELTTTSIDGQTDYTSGRTINYTVASAAETVDVVIGNDGSYYRYIQVVLPVVQSQGGGEKYENVHAKVEWFMNDAANPGANYSEPDGVFSTVAFDYGDAEITGTSNITNENAQKETTGIKFKPSGTTKSLVWSVKPAAGLTFTPTRIAGYVNRCGTDVENGITISARVGDGEPIVLGTWTALRSGKTSAQKPYDATAIYLYAIDLTAEQQAALTSGETLFLESTIGVGATKDGAFGEVVIDGLINGEKADIAMYTLTTAANPAEGGSVSTYPVSEQYEAGSEVTLTATENFGYDFVNWTNAAGDEVSTEAKFKYTMTADETLTANFKAVETYELALTIDGTNPYMVTISPAPTLVDGKMMYEAGTTVELNANQYEGLVTFTNWSDGETAANKIVKMDDNVTLSAVYAQADIIAGWDFYKAGNNGRKADFAAADNDADALSLVNTETGETSGWLDKSTEAGGGYESFKGAAVNWRTGSSNGDVGNWHWQTKVNAEAFTNITVQFQMLYNYNAYQRYNAEFSTDGENWTNFGSITMEGAKAPASFNETLPEAANNQKDLFIRMIADKTSNVDGSASANDGNTLAMFFITGTPKLVDDPVAPALVSSVPANGATGASASGKIVLNFDKKVQLVEGTVATLGAMELTPTVSGKVITFEYKGLEYSKEYTFTLPANTVQNLTGATLADAIAINFTTMERPTIEKGLYDEVVSTAEELAAAIKAANERADKTTRYRIFIKKGIYALPSGANKHYTHTNSSTGQVYFDGDRPDPITYVTGGKISFIGEDRDATIITQAAANETFAGQFGTTSIYDGIGNSDVLQLSGDDYYFQDLTIKSGIEDARGRNLAVQDQSKKSIYKNVCLFGYQDTWTSNNDRGLYYFEGGIIRGRTDYICGKGDAYFDQVEFRQIAGGYCAVPSKPANIGWVMKDCVINGDGSGVDGNYTLGRPWGSGTPVAVWIDTKMNVVPSAIGWNEMGTGWPKRFAEYNSTTSTGSVIDLSGRKKTFGDGHTNNPVLTAEEALEYSNKDKMFGDWNPQLMTESAPMVTDVKLVGTILSWTGNSYSLLYAICKNGEIIAYTKDTTFDLSTLSSEESGSRRSGEESVVYSVRAANEMGGLGEAAEAVVATGIEEIAPATTTADGKVYNLQGIRVDKAQKGLYIINGRKVVIK